MASELLQARAHTTTQLYADPHNPHLYLDRARLYEKLGFPDLAAADAYRALSLLESVVDPDGFEFHAKKVVEGKKDNGDEAGDKNEDEDEDEDEDDGTVPVTQEEYDALIGEVYAVLVRSLVRCGCYRDAYDFGVRGLGLLRDLANTPSSATTVLNEQMDQIKTIYKFRTDTQGDIDLESIDSAALPAQGKARRVLYPWNEHEPDRRAPEELRFFERKTRRHCAQM